MQLTVNRLIFNLAKKVFLLLFCARFFSEYIDILLKTQFSALICVLFIGLYILVLFARPVMKKSAVYYQTVWSLFCVVMICSYFINESVGNSLVSVIKEVLRYFVIGCFFHLYSIFYSDQRSRDQFFDWVYYCVFVSCLFSVVQGVLGKGKNVYADGEARTAGFMSDPVIFAVMVVLFIGLYTAHSFYDRSSRQRMRLILLYVIGVVAIYFTKARTAWIMLLLFMLFVLYLRGGNKNLKLFFPLIAAVLLPFTFERFEDLATVTKLFNQVNFGDEVNYRLVESSFHWRIFQWNHLLTLWLEQPMFGYGPGMSVVLGLNGLSAHSSIVEILVEQGLVGFFIIIFYVCVFLFGLPKKYENHKIIRFLFFSLLPVTIFSLSFINQTFNLMVLSVIISYVIQTDKEQREKEAAISETK